MQLHLRWQADGSHVAGLPSTQAQGRAVRGPSKLHATATKHLRGWRSVGPLPSQQHCHDRLEAPQTAAHQGSHLPHKTERNDPQVTGLPYRIRVVGVAAVR